MLIEEYKKEIERLSGDIEVLGKSRDEELKRTDKSEQKPTIELIAAQHGELLRIWTKKKMAEAELKKKEKKEMAEEIMNIY